MIMAETRIDILRDENAALKAAIRVMLSSTGEIKGRAIAEHLVGTYRPPLESICPSCGNKTIGSCQRQGCQ